MADRRIGITRGAETFKTIAIRKPNAGTFRVLALRDVVQADTVSMLTLLPRITTPTLHAKDLEEMDCADFVECCHQVSVFLQQQGAGSASPAE